MKVTQGELNDAKLELLGAIVDERKIHERNFHGRYSVSPDHERLMCVERELAEHIKKADARLAAICKHLGITLVWDGGYFVPETCRAVKKGKSK